MLIHPAGQSCLLVAHGPQIHVEDLATWDPPPGQPLHLKGMNR
jgi:hypothetical protein